MGVARLGWLGVDIFGSWLRSASTYSDQATGQRHELHIDVIAEKKWLGKKMSLLLRYADANVQPQHQCTREVLGGGRPIRIQPPMTLDHRCRCRCFKRVCCDAFQYVALVRVTST